MSADRTLKGDLVLVGAGDLEFGGRSIDSNTVQNNISGDGAGVFDDEAAISTVIYETR